MLQFLARRRTSGHERQRDKAITRRIHRIFWEATLQDKTMIWLTYLLRIPALVLYHVGIPVLIALGIQAIVSGRYDDVMNYALGALGCAAGYAILWALGGITIVRNGITGSEYLINCMFDNYLRKDYDFYANTMGGSLGSQLMRMRDVYTDYCLIVFLSGPKQLVIVAVGLLAIGIQSMVLAVVTVIAMLLTLSFTVWSSSKRLELRRDLSIAHSDLSGAVQDALAHATTVKSYAHEGYELEHIRGALNRWSMAQRKSWLSASPADAGRMMLAALATAVLLVVTARLYKEGAITLAVVALVQLYVIKLVAATQEIAEIVKQYEQVMGAAYRAMQVFLVEPSVIDPLKPKKLPSDHRLSMSFHSVSYQYPDAAPGSFAIDSFDLDIAPGEKIGIVGYSGSGKTTATKLILRFADVSSGSIRIGGKDIRDLLQQDLRRAVAYVPQEPLLFHRSIYDNIAYGNPKAKKQAVLAAAKAAYVDEFVADLPKAYATMVGERGVKLSGGQRQRVAIARAILKNAPILVLDEATSALDSRSETFVQDALWRLMDGRTALVVAHRLSTIQCMDRIIVMDKGKIIAIGTHDELLKQDGIYAQLWSHQSGGYIGASNDQ